MERSTGFLCLPSPHLRNTVTAARPARAKLASPVTVGFYLRAECAKIAVRGQTGGGQAMMMLQKCIKEAGTMELRKLHG